MFVIFKNDYCYQWLCSRQQSSSTITIIEAEEKGEQKKVTINQSIAAINKRNKWIDLQNYPIYRVIMSKWEDLAARHHHHHYRFDSHRRIIMVE